MRLGQLVAITAGVVAALAGTAAAYPQFQLSRDQTCTGCHIAPAGGGLLNENGTQVADSISQYSNAPEFMYNKVKLPKWLMLGGDFRAASGYFVTGGDPTNTVVNDPSNTTPTGAFALFPMQGDIYAHAHFGAFSVQITAGGRPTEWDNENATHLWSREHYLMWQSNPDGNEGVYVRVGKFMPVFGLRQVEHVDYNRMYGGTPLYGEVYGAAVEYVTQKYEVHASGFIKGDPIEDPVVDYNGGALYAETRLSEHTAVGLEGMLTDSDGLTTYRGGFTAKQYLAGPDLLLMAEGQVVTERVKNDGGVGAPAQLVGYLMASRFFSTAVMVDLGIGHYDENIRIEGLDRDAIDLNVHWFTTSHIELLLMNRLSKAGLGPGPGGPGGGWTMLQIHYRL